MKQRTPRAKIVATLGPASRGEDVLRDIRQSPLVRYAERNLVARLAGEPAENPPDDPWYPQQWHLENIGQSGGKIDADVDAPEAWAITRGSNGIVVAVLDTGINFKHPEFVGRLPVISAVHQLTRDNLVEILTEPKNALVKQYQRFFGYDNVELVFTEEALWEIADKALDRETGARGLRSIIESALLDVMFELPSRRDVSKCVITKETIQRGLKPTLVTSAGRPALDLPDERVADGSA